MQYFTPDLIARGQSGESQILNEVETLWDEACARYEAYVDCVRQKLPSGLRSLEEKYYLHDAVVQSMGYRVGCLTVVLQLDTPPRSLLTLAYKLAEAPHIVRDALPAFCRTPASRVEWLYDEIALVSGVSPTWRQSILLSNGWEVELHFLDVEVQEMEHWLPAEPAAAIHS